MHKRTQKLVTVEVDHVVGILSDPDFGFPSDVIDVSLELFEIGEGRNVNSFRGAPTQLLL
jgi:hypothetical protein